MNKEYILPIIATIFIVDLLAFTMWTLSGQTPQDGFYIGMITGNIIKLIQ